MPTPAEIVSAARAWIDTPFAHQGRLRGVGCDCIGLVVGVAADLGIATPDRAGYSRHPAGILQAALNAALIAAPAPAPGRVLLLRWEGEPTHVALVGPHPSGAFSLIHAYAPSRKVVEHILDATWAARIVQAYEFPA